MIRAQQQRSGWQRALLLMAAFGTLAPDQGVADEPNTLTLSVAETVQRDNNLFRLPDGLSPVINGVPGSRGDTLSSTQLGLRFAHTYGRQDLRANVNYAINKYREYAYLDYNPLNLGLNMDWQVGNHWRGSLVAEQAQSLTNFANTRGFQQTTNTYRRSGGDANYWWHPDWATGVGVYALQNRYSGNSQPLDDYDAAVAELKLTYQPRSGNRVGLLYRHTDASYPNRSTPVLGLSLLDTGFGQEDLRATANWQLSGASRLDGQLGFTRLRYDVLSNRDFQGVTGNLNYAWQPSAKTSLNAAVSREIGPRQDVTGDYVANYVLTSSVTLAPTWLATEKTSLQATVKWLNEVYPGVPLGLSSVFPRREDRTWLLGLTAGYNPTRKLSFRMAVQQQKRDSNYPGDQYNDTTASITGALTW
ncbi:XrtB/PEP-CTERM-associated polysaccharide biosynthesis outer membrane protein EpsL [Accumulibacter sp.]|jgi:exopolysaccharide biosynthesis operon protein EpsL|uniref:Conserved hypothetical secreted protein n=1 Tax=Accumulibacter regalis TaxID=522306 RepID=C7RNR5_ACCRE|nr:XrtB/PEP-CTERM-associated polysaccharide biosynthesis outer membrane protein EpsL [Accumulibacter sp.]MBN8499134.1 outer membrane beta-barrel protein [Accumulibacter sp.]MBO3714201.1 outer membrane beta-barrel protein [Accumulibacter sp.]